MTKLYRSTRDKKVFGLCGGLAELFNIDATILRLVVAVGVIFSGGAVLLLYVVASLVIPKETDAYQPHAQYQPFGGQAAPSQTTQAHTNGAHTTQAQTSAPSIDDLMKDIEKKAMQKEIEELKARLAKLEKGDE